jgi:hypothetical protein
MLIDRAKHEQYDASLSLLAWKWLPLLIIIAGMIRLLWFVRQPWELVQPIVIIVIAIAVLAGLGLYEPVSPLPTYRLVPLLWPATMILIGIWLVVAPSKPRAAVSDQDDELRIVLWLRGEARHASPTFTAGRVLVVLGYLQLDLRETRWDGLCTLDVTVLVGHVRILVAPGAPFDRHSAFVLARGGLRYRDPPVVIGDETLLRVSVIGIGGDAVVAEGGQLDEGHHPMLESS